MVHHLKLIALLCLCGCASVRLQPGVEARFDVVVLGGSGGIIEGDLTSFLVSRAGSGEYVALDLGTLYAGLERAARSGALPRAPGSKWNDAAEVLKHHLHAGFVSHPHFDHVAGLIIGSPELTKLDVYGLPSTLDALRAHAFSGALWANFTDEGAQAIGRIHLAAMTPGTPVTVAPAALTVEAFPLSHGGMTSTAFLVEGGAAALLYLGDTGPDAVERSDELATLWRRVAPLLKTGRLRAILLEASFADPRDQKLLFGHLTPAWIREELDVLAKEAGSLQGLELVITHVKPSLERGADARKTIKEQLRPLEQRGVRVTIVEGGQRLQF